MKKRDVILLLSILISILLFVTLINIPRTDEPANFAAKNTDGVSSTVSPHTTEDSSSNTINISDYIITDSENDIEYANILTESYWPIASGYWIPICLHTAHGNPIDAYIRFTEVIRDETVIQEQTNAFAEYMGVKSYQTSSSDRLTNIMVLYEIYLPKNMEISKDDYLLPSNLIFPIRLFSTQEDGEFGESGLQGAEHGVSDISIFDNKELEPGETISKTILCTLPKNYTEYGLEVTYLDKYRHTCIIYCKPE